MADILIVDDDLLSRSWLEKFLLRAGYSVEAVSSGFQAAARLRVSSYRVVITDVTMPEMDGIELADIILRLAPSTAIIAVSGSLHSLREPIASLLRLKGARCLLGKPIEPDELLAALDGVVTPRPTPQRH
jgi:CheY-like chemotaxis protein